MKSRKEERLPFVRRKGQGLSARLDNGKDLAREHGGFNSRGL